MGWSNILTSANIAIMASSADNSLTEQTAPDLRHEVRKPKKKKVLLMGKSGSGKSSMRSIIFSNYIARDTRRLGATIDIDLSHVKFLGNLTLNLWDCGGQEAFMENYLSQQRVHVFSNVGVLIYVFDVESRDVERDLATYVAILSALLQFSPQARIYILIHKMDLVVPRHARPSTTTASAPSAARPWSTPPTPWVVPPPRNSTSSPLPPPSGTRACTRPGPPLSTTSSPICPSSSAIWPISASPSKPRSFCCLSAPPSSPCPRGRRPRASEIPPRTASSACPTL